MSAERELLDRACAMLEAVQFYRFDNGKGGCDTCGLGGETIVCPDCRCEDVGALGECWNGSHKGNCALAAILRDYKALAKGGAS